jgi:hypothetical protein
MTAADRAPEERDRRLDELAAVDAAVRLSPPHRRGAVARSYDETARGAFLLVWSPADSEFDAWHGAAVRAEDIGDWLRPVLNPLFDGLSFGAWLSDGRQRSLWAVRAAGARAQRRVRGVNYFCRSCCLNNRRYPSSPLISYRTATPV